MKTRSILCIIAPCVLLLVSCPMANVSTPETPVPAAQQIANPGFTVETDAARGQAVFIDAKGTRIDIQSAEEDGSVVACAEAVSVAAMAADEQPAAKSLFGRLAAIVIGKRADGWPGAWIINPDNTIESPVSEESGRHTSCLPESDEMDGSFRGRFGWVYTVMGISEDGKVIVGYAKSERGFTWHGGKIDPGTTIGVYWRVWRPAGGRFCLVSRARIIGVLDPSKLPGPDRRHPRWFDWLFAHSLQRLKWFLLDYLTSYLIMVEKNGVTYSETKGVYEIKGTDQDKRPAIATIDKEWKIAIEPVETGLGRCDLRPGSMSFTGDAVADGGNLLVTLPIENLQPDTVTDGFDVHFYLAASSAFSPVDDTDLGAVTVTAGVPGNSSITINGSLLIPELQVNEARYVYAVVDSTGAVAESDETNNQSTADTAAAVLVYDDDNASRTYDIVLQTYLGSDPSKTAGVGVTDTLMALYKDNSPTATYLAPADTSGSSDFSRIPNAGSLTLERGIYYVVVLSWAPRNGPYALSVRTGNVDLRGIADLASSAQDTWEPDDDPTPSLLSPANTTIPSKPDPLKVGAGLSRWSAADDFDWFTFVLP